MARPSSFPAGEPFPVFDDGVFGQPTPIINHAPMPPAKAARQPLQTANANVILNPPALPAAKSSQSPFKPTARPSSSPRAPMAAPRSNPLNMVPMMPPGKAQPSTDSPQKKQPLMSRFKTVAKKPQPDFHVQITGKENLRPPIYPAPTQSGLDLDLENYFQKPSGKRALLEAAPIKEVRPAKRQKTEETLPPHDSYPPIIDDGTKPNHSYATLIAMAIVRSPQRRLTLSQIYKWISDTFSYYTKPETGWQNSIRHNLSLNKAFIKQERPKDDPGKGSYWSIEPGAELALLKEKPSRKSAAPTAENMPVMSTRLEPSQPQLQAPPLPRPLPQPSCMPEHMLPPPPPPPLSVPQSILPALPPASSQQLAPAPPFPEISSDATIPVSDATIPVSDAATVDEAVGRVGADIEPYSPLPAAMHSSPPIPRRMEVRHNDTPPSHSQVHPSSGPKSRHRRRIMSMDDSGYISSLESSVMRPHQHSKLLTSEADRPRIKRGRAEEEIVRLRASSYDSPSKGRSYGFPPPSSSPIRQTSHSAMGQMLPPLTPAMKLKAPAKPPSSVSPSTNLRLHRQNMQSLIESPFRRLSELLPEGDNPALQTPSFEADGLWYDIQQSVTNPSSFDIFEDAPGFPAFAWTPTAAVDTGSPIKKSARKQRSDKSQSTGALSNITNSARSSCKSVSFLKAPAGQATNLALETPSKVFEGLPSSPSKLFLDLQSPSKMPLINDENLHVFPEVSLDGLDGLDTPSLLDESDFSGFDMLAGFEKIGSSNAHSQAPAPRGPRSSQQGSLSRSYTATF